MGYISDIRKYVGHMPIQHTAASVIVENEKGEILLQKRTDNGTWSYCGGAVELFERVEDAAARELLEETGLKALSLELFGIFSGEEQHYIYPNGDEVSTIDIVYICKSFSGELKCQPEEVLELRFFGIDEIPENISPPTCEPLRKYMEYRRGAMF
ncbi:MAG: NUDIX hydrolase [Huintestinicola sp.]|uniref:NUDIX hydrolase n=1 Tax=Huintestinicola sp. TaxID=2981661 RepID=UPI003F01F369